MSGALAGFVPAFLHGLLLNVTIAATGLLLGLAGGVPLALLRLRGGRSGGLAGIITAVLRMLPTFVVMFFLLNLLPPSVQIGALAVPLHGPTLVTLSLVVYAAAYASDAALEALRHWRRGAQDLSLLFLPAMARAFFVMIMSSSTGAAIGVNEAVTVTLRRAEALPAMRDRLLLFGAVILFFACLLQGAFQLVEALRRRLAGRPRRMAAAAREPGSTRDGVI